jgi:O-antigen/teichoic acid export membrane protein
MALGVVIVLVPESQWTYIHAHKRSPHLLLTLVGSILSALLMWKLGADYGALGVSVAYLVMMALYYFPLWSWVWWVCRANWHDEQEPTAAA